MIYILEKLHTFRVQYVCLLSRACQTLDLIFMLLYLHFLVLVLFVVMPVKQC